MDKIRSERKLQRVKENRKYILEAAEKIFALKGYSGATMDEIAEEAHFSKVTLYRYFQSKNDIFFDIIFNSLELVKEKILEISKERIPSELKLRKIITYILAYYKKKKNMARIFYMEKPMIKKMLSLYPQAPQSKDHAPFQQHPKIPDKFIHMLVDINKIINQVIQQGVNQKEFREIDVQEAGFILGAMLRGVYFRGPILEKEISLDKSTDLLLDFFLHGIKKEKTC